MSNLFSSESNPSLLDIIENSTRLFINFLRLYSFEKYASFINENIFLNFSKPKPIITAANVPPKTIIIGPTRKRVFIDPPSMTKAPKIDAKPRINPRIDPILFIRENPLVILTMS